MKPVLNYLSNRRNVVGNLSDDEDMNFCAKTM